MRRLASFFLAAALISAALVAAALAHPAASDRLGGAPPAVQHGW